MTDRQSNLEFAFKLPSIWLWMLLGLLLALINIVLPIGMLLAIFVVLVAIVLIVLKPERLMYALAFLISFQIEIELAQLAGATLSPETIGAIGILFIAAMLIMLTDKGIYKATKLPHLWLWIAFLIISSIAIAKGPIVTGFTQGVWAVYRIVWSGPLFLLGIWLIIKSPRSIWLMTAFISLGATIGSMIAIIQTLSFGRFFSGIITNFRYLGFLHTIPYAIIADYSEALRDK